jgi:hypothetical protein
VQAGEALIEAIGILAAQAIPAYQDMVRACKGAAWEEPEVLAACRRVATILRRGDTCLTQMIGLAIARRVWPQDSAEYREVLEAQRVARYRMAVDLPIYHASRWHDEAADHSLDLLSAHATEQEVFRAQLIEAGRAVDPRADWKEPTLLAN